MGMKQQTFFLGTYLNLTSYFTMTKILKCKILKYFKDFYNGNLSISSQDWAQKIKMKQNQMEHVQIRQNFF